jgi:HlyD family secretion protein
MRGKKLVFIILGVVVVAVLVVVNLTKERSEGTGSRRTAEVNSGKVTTGTLVAKVSGPGRVRAEKEVEISSSVLGTIETLAVEEGDTVEQGQLLLRLDDAQYRADVQRYEAAVERARSEKAKAERDLRYARAQYEKNHLSEKGLKDAEVEAEVSASGLEQAQALLESSRDALSKTVFRSPISGVVSRVNVEEGENVITGTMNNPGTVLMTISDLSSMIVEADIDETDVRDVKHGQTAEIRIDAFPDTTLDGTVIEVGVSGRTTGLGTQQEVTNFPVDVRVDDSISGLRPGMSATVRIITAVRESAKAVPIQSVVSRTRSDIYEEDSDDEDEDIPTIRDEEPKIEGVFVIADEVAGFVELSTGISDERFIEVEGDLEIGDKVVTGPYKVLRTLKEGDRVKVVKGVGTE